MKSKRTTVPGDRILRLPQVLERVGCSRSHWWAGVRAGQFPESVKLSERVTGWLESELDSFIADPEAWQAAHKQP
ncbi:MAG: hypothetical protein JWQ89_2277 [Devosia sp.]|uniref:helix-turn-helix transcriptional regulator n=1 Tax=Devosia sp. TaxID=1871048 RepID=UPI002A6E77C9|nr:hypothetical protein [Devosia sp.]